MKNITRETIEWDLVDWPLVLNRFSLEFFHDWKLHTRKTIRKSIKIRMRIAKQGLMMIYITKEESNSMTKNSTNWTVNGTKNDPWCNSSSCWPRKSTFNRIHHSHFQRIIHYSKEISDRDLSQSKSLHLMSISISLDILFVQIDMSSLIFVDR